MFMFCFSGQADGESKLYGANTLWQYVSINTVQKIQDAQSDRPTTIDHSKVGEESQARALEVSRSELAEVHPQYSHLGYDGPIAYRL